MTIRQRNERRSALYGYQGKLLFVNLSTGNIEIRPLKEEDARNFIGGPALGAKILYEEMPANADVFGEDSMVGFVTGPLNNNRALFGSRYTVVSKSPVTGGWNDANAGGYFGPMLKAAGFDAVFVNGISEKPVYVFVDEGRAEILDASDLWGLTVSEAETKLRAKHGEKINAALIGPGGENLSYFAAVINDGHRAAGRGGTGAVIGSKNLKAVVVRGNLSTEVADRKKLVAANKSISDNMKGAAAELATAFGRFGTGIFYIPSTLSSDASIKNWGGAAGIDYTEEEAYLVSSANLEQFVLKKYNCSNCPLACGAILDVPSERWELANIDRPEYETMGAFGSQILNSDYESVLCCNLLCNEYGLDTISAGATVSWVVECYENGLFTKEELGGIEATWGNGDSIVALTELICKNEGIGQVLIKGTRYAADHLGKGHEYLVVASGIEEPQHDGRLAYGVTRTYQYDPTPGRHVKGGLGLAPSGPDFDYSDTGEADLQGVVGTEVLNSSGFCMFGSMVSPPDALLKLIEAITGFQYSPEEFRKLGTRMFNMRHAFNIREGMSRKDFTLSKRFYESNPPYEGPIAGVKVNHERLADNFFETIGWDNETLIPSLSSLEELGGMEAVIADLYG